MANRTPDPGIGDLLPSWVLSLRVDNTSPMTAKSCERGVRFYLAHCEERDLDPLDRHALRSCKS